MDSGSKVQFSDREALLYHEYGRPGKIEIVASKPMATQRDLSLAYSPGVAVPVNAIAEDPAKAYDYTIKGNLVAVISNGTASLGLERKRVVEGTRGGVGVDLGGRWINKKKRKQTKDIPKNKQH